MASATAWAMSLEPLQPASSGSHARRMRPSLPAIKRARGPSAVLSWRMPEPREVQCKQAWNGFLKDCNLCKRLTLKSVEHAYTQGQRTEPVPSNIKHGLQVHQWQVQEGVLLLLQATAFHNRFTRSSLLFAERGSKDKCR